MQIRCSNCHKPFAIGKDEIHMALDTITAEGLAHYNAYCPHCRRANRISPEELHRAAPDWQPNTAQERQQSNKD
jgi:phage FluMu protein Com